MKIENVNSSTCKATLLSFLSMFGISFLLTVLFAMIPGRPDRYVFDLVGFNLISLGVAVISSFLTGWVVFKLAKDNFPIITVYLSVLVISFGTLFGFLERHVDILRNLSARAEFNVGIDPWWYLYLEYLLIILAIYLGASVAKRFKDVNA